jgi:hypothetical protein
MQLRYTDFFLNCVQQTRKTAAEEKKHKTDGASKKRNKRNLSSELILSIINKKLHKDLQMSLIVMLHWNQRN